MMTENRRIQTWFRIQIRNESVKKTILLAKQNKRIWKKSEWVALRRVWEHSIWFEYVCVCVCERYLAILNVHAPLLASQLSKPKTNCFFHFWFSFPWIYIRLCVCIVLKSVKNRLWFVWFAFIISIVVVIIRMHFPETVHPVHPARWRGSNSLVVFLFGFTNRFLKFVFFIYCLVCLVCFMYL